MDQLNQISVMGSGRENLHARPDSLDLVILAGYFVVIVTVGVISARLVRNREDFLMGGRRFGKIMTAFFTYGAGIYTNNIHNKIFSEGSDEKTQVTLNRLAAAAFALIVTPLAYAFSDVPEAMRFMFLTVPLMGISFFVAIWWRPANRWGAFAGVDAGVRADGAAGAVDADADDSGLE